MQCISSITKASTTRQCKQHWHGVFGLLVNPIGNYERRAAVAVAVAGPATCCTRIPCCVCVFSPFVLGTLCRQHTATFVRPLLVASPPKHTQGPSADRRPHSYGALLRHLRARLLEGCCAHAIMRTLSLWARRGHRGATNCWKRYTQRPGPECFVWCFCLAAGIEL
jgi:hypothetical protein